jgi:CRISPR-associated protein Csm2
MTPQRPHQGRPGGHRPHQGSAPPLRAIPTPQQRPHPYRGAAGQLDPFWVDGGAQAAAESFRELPSTQLRRFFSEVKGMARQLDLLTSRDKGERTASKEEAWPRIHPQFAMLKSKVVYAQGRLGKNMPDTFVQFIINHVAWVESVEDFESFLSHFEAVVGFHRYLTTAKG